MATSEPTAYAAARAPFVAGIWRQAGGALATMAPRAFPGCEPTAFAAFTAISYPGGFSDVTTAAGFYELGAWQTPGGDPSSGPAPRPGSTWETLARGQLVRDLLGRAATTDPGTWRTAVDDQAAVGLANLRRDLASSGVIPSALGSLWGVSVAFCAFSAGPSGAGALVARFDPGGDERDRWWRLVARVLEAAAGGAFAGLAANHHNPAYTVLRTCQKLACGLQLARALVAADGPTAANPAWYAWGLEAAGERALAAAARGAGAPSSGAGASSGTDGGSLLGLALVGALLGGAAWMARRSRRR